MKRRAAPGASWRRGTRRVRIVFRPLMSRTHALTAPDGAARQARRAGSPRAPGGCARSVAARARRRRLLGQGRRQRQPDRRQAAVRGQVRLLPHARAGRNQRHRRPQPRRSVPREPRRRRRSRHGPRGRRRTDPDPQPRRRDAEEPRQRRRRAETSPPTSRRRSTKPGKDTGLLATAVQAPGAGKPAVEKARQAVDRRQPKRPAGLRDQQGHRAQPGR